MDGIKGNKIAMKTFSQKQYLFFAIIFIISIFFVAEAEAVKIGPTGQELSYAPGAKASFTYFAVNDDGEDGDYTFSLDGDLSEYATFDEKLDLVRLSVGEVKYFKVNIAVPETGIEPGKKSLKVHVRKVPKKSYGQTVGAYPEVVLSLISYVPFPDKYLVIKKLETKEKYVIGDTAYFQLIVMGMGKVPIETVSGFLEISDKDKIIATIPLTEATDVKELEEQVMYAEWNIDAKVPPGYYQLWAKVKYDNIKDELTKKEYLLVGDEQIEILSLSPTEIPFGKISKITLKNKNYWNLPLSYYAELSLIKDNQTLVSGTSPTQEIKSWEEQDISAYLDFSQFNSSDSGKYHLKGLLNYGQKKTEKIFEVSLGEEKPELSVENDSDKFSWSTISIMMVILLIVAIGSLVYLLMTRKNDSEL